MEGLGLSAVVRMAKRSREVVPARADFSGKRPHEASSQFADISGSAAETVEVAKPTQGLDAAARALKDHVMIVTGGGRVMDPETMMKAIKFPILIERAAHSTRDAYTLHSGVVHWLTARTLVIGNHMDQDEAERPGNEVVASVVRAVPVVARNLIFAILLGVHPSSRSNIFRMDSTLDHATYQVDTEAQFPARLEVDSPVDWGNGIQGIVESGDWADALLVSIRTPFATRDCNRLFGASKTDTVTPIGRGAGEIAERYMQPGQPDIAAALLIPRNAAVPMATRNILLGARVSLAPGSPMTFPLPPYYNTNSLNALAPMSVGGNRRDMLENLAYTIFLLYSNDADFNAWRAATTNANLGLTAPMLTLVGRDLATLGFDDNDAAVVALTTVGGRPFSDVALAASAQTGVTAFSDLVCFGATAMQTAPLTMIPKGGVITAMTPTRWQIRQDDQQQLTVTPIAGNEIGIAISPNVRVWMDAVIVDFHTDRPRDRDFFALPATWLRSWALNQTLAGLVALPGALAARADRGNADAPDPLFAAARTLTGATVLGAPCPSAYGQVMRVLARLSDMNLAEAVRSAALR